MGYPVPPPWPPPPPPPRTNGVDIAVSVLLIVLTVVSLAFGSLMGLFSMTFLDNCPPATCSVEAAVTASMTTVAIAAVVGLAGIITTIVRLAMRKRAWPFAIGTLAACMAVFFVGAMAYTGAVG